MPDQLIDAAGSEVSHGPTKTGLMGKRILFAARALAAAILTYLFMILLMTVIAQGGVVARLKALSPPPTYSSAYAEAAQIDGRLAEAGRLHAEANRLALASHGRLSEVPRLQQDVEALSGRVGRLHQQVASFCRFEPEAVSMVGTSYLWYDLVACARRAGFPEAAKAQLDAIHSSGPSLPTIIADLQLASSFGQQWRQQAERLQEISVRRRSLTERETQIRAAFEELAKLRNSALLGGGLLVEFPPALLQLPLAFFAGMFGAMLLTLVLVVYPNSGFTKTSTDRLESRILLGGLIALCVYVVLLGGAAILGTPTGVTADSTNYMTFCAVGILAGMFSDRVAAWLSDRANIFFKPGNEASGQG